MKKISGFVVMVLLLASLTACGPGSSMELDKTDSEVLFIAPGPNPEIDQPAESGKVAGFGTGLWHGLISVVTLALSFINPETQMYEVHNTGSLYNFGFLLGAALLFLLFGYTGGRRR